MDNSERVLKCLREICPDWATNAQLTAVAGVSSHQGVFQVTRRLAEEGLIQAEQRGRKWFFRVLSASPDPPSGASLDSPDSAPASLARAAAGKFESTASDILRAYFGCALERNTTANVPKCFDFVASDGTIVGDAKFFDLVKGKYTPPAKFSIIAEHVWLLEKTKARCGFLVFGHNRSVPSKWLEKYGHLLERVAFLFIGDDGQIEILIDPAGTFMKSKCTSSGT